MSDNQLATARLLAAMSAARFAGPLVLASSMVVYGEGRYRCASHGLVQAAPRLVAIWMPDRFDPSVPGLRRASVVGCRRRVGPSRSPVGLRLVEGRPGTLVRVMGARGGKHRPARASWRCATTTCTGRDFLSGLLTQGWPHCGAAHCHAARHPGFSRTDSRPAISCTLSTWQPPISSPCRWLHPAEVFEAVNVCSGQPSTILDVADGLCDAFGPDAPRPVVTGEYRLGDVRHVVASASHAARASLGFHGPDAALRRVWLPGRDPGRRALGHGGAGRDGP